MAKSPPNYFVPALEKGLDVIETLATAPTPQTLTELSRTLNRSSSVLFRIIDALEKRGYIVRDPISGGYKLTLRLYELAHTQSPVDQILRASTLPMQELSNAIHESCHLGILSGGKFVVVAESRSPDSVRISMDVGSQMAPLLTASGQLLVAFLSREEQELVINADGEYGPDHGRREELLAQLQRIRGDGYSLSESKLRQGVDLAVLVGNPLAGIVAALGVACLAGGRNHGKEASLLTPLRDCAEKITRTLGVRMHAIGSQMR